jgi:hypothetical protein
MSTTIDYRNPTQTPKVPLSERFNLRLLIFIGVIAILVGYPVCVLVQQQLSGGVTSVAGGYKEVNLKALGNFVFDDSSGTVNDVPAKYRELDGQKVLLIGEMYSGTGAGEVNSFELVYSIAKCCFGGPPKVQERVFCYLPKNSTSALYGGFSRVTGTLHLKLTRNEVGKITTLYTLDVDKIIPES